MKKLLTALAIVTTFSLQAQNLPDSLFHQLAKIIDQRDGPAIQATMLGTSDFYNATNALVKGFMGDYPFTIDSAKMHQDSLLYTHYLTTHINDSLLSRLPKDTKLNYHTHTYTIIHAPESMLTGCSGTLTLQGGEEYYELPIRNAVHYNGGWKIISFGKITTSTGTQNRNAPPVKLSPFDTEPLQLSDVRVEAVESDQSPPPPPPPPPPTRAKPKKSHN